MVIHQQIHDDIRTRAAVEDIPHDMQVIDDQTLDQVAHRDDELLCAVGLDDGRNNRIEVFALIVNVIILVEQFVDDVAVPARQGASHLFARVFGRAQAADLEQTAERDAVPLCAVGRGLDQLRELFFRVVDERREPRALVRGQAVAQHVVHLFAYRARSVV